MSLYNIFPYYQFQINDIMFNNKNIKLKGMFLNVSYFP